MSTTYKTNVNQLTVITDDDKNQLLEVADDMFTYHPWSLEQVKAGGAVRDALKNAFITIVQNVPASADRSAALRKLREARMDANSAITHGGRY